MVKGHLSSPSIWFELVFDYPQIPDSGIWQFKNHQALHSQLFIYTHTHTYVYACVYMCIGVYAHSRIHIHIRVSMCMYRHAHTYNLTSTTMCKIPFGYNLLLGIPSTSLTLHKLDFILPHISLYIYAYIYINCISFVFHGLHIAGTLGWGPPWSLLLL